MRFAQNLFLNIIVVDLCKLFFEIIDFRFQFIDLTFQFIDLLFVFMLCVGTFLGLLEGHLSDWLVLQFQWLNNPLFCKNFLSYCLSFKTLWTIVSIQIFHTLAVQNSAIFSHFIFIFIIFAFHVIFNYTGVTFKPLMIYFTIVLLTWISLEL